MQNSSLFLILFLIVPSLFAADEIEGLIDKEQAAESVWVDSDGDLPPARLLGTETAVRIYSPANETTRDNLLCSSVEFDEILELEREEKISNEIKLNISIPRIRESISDSCLIRPGDPLLAVGPGWQELVVVKEFIVRSEKPICPNDPPYSLWVNFDAPLRAEPFFFSTEVELPTSTNGYVSIDGYKAEPLDRRLKEKLAQDIPFFDEYETGVYTLDATKGDRLITVKRKSVSSDDSSLISEAVYVEKGGLLTMVQSEQVDSTHGSGHLAIEGFLDFDGDKILDLLLIGDHQGCSYQSLFKGTEMGFERLDLPTRPCSC